MYVCVCVTGPANPYSKDAGLRNHRAGHVEDAYMHPHHFEEQYHMFHNKGYGHAPGTQILVGEAAVATEEAGPAKRYAMCVCVCVCVCIELSCAYLAHTHPAHRYW